MTAAAYLALILAVLCAALFGAALHYSTEASREKSRADFLEKEIEGIEKAFDDAARIDSETKELTDEELRDRARGSWNS